MVQFVNWVIFAGGLFIGLCCGITISALLTNGKMCDLEEEIRVLNQMNSNEK